MPKYILLHSSLKVAVEGRMVTLGVGDTAELSAAFVAEHDPKGMSFITEAQYSALVEQSAAMKKAQAKVEEKAAELDTEKAKLAKAKMSAKHLAAVEMIEAKKLEKKSAVIAKEEKHEKGGGK